MSRADRAPDTQVAAGLLHDICQFLDRGGDVADGQHLDEHHASSRAAFLERHYPPAVVAPIRLHVAAKRYLCAVDATYQSTSSNASAASLRAQAILSIRRRHWPFGACLMAGTPSSFVGTTMRGNNPSQVAPPDYYRPLLTRLLL